MNIRIHKSIYGDYAIAGDESLGASQLAKGYANANRMLLSQVPLLLVFTSNPVEEFIFYDNLYILNSIDASVISLDVILFNDALCETLLRIGVQQLSPKSVNDILQVICDEEHFVDWEERGLKTFAIPRNTQPTEMVLKDNLGFEMHLKENTVEQQGN